MGIELVNVGAEPNDATGDPLRTAFEKINNNFIYLQQTSSNLASAVTLDDTADQVIFEYPANEFTQAMFQIKSFNEDTNDSQGVMLQAQISNDSTDVKFSGYGTTVFGNSVTTYNMAVLDGNVILTVSPLANVVLTHFISYQVTWIGDLGVGVGMLTQADGNLVTESANVFIQTEG